MSFQLLGPSPMSSRTIHAAAQTTATLSSLYTFGLRLFFFFSKKKKFQQQQERERVNQINK